MPCHLSSLSRRRNCFLALLAVLCLGIGAAQARTGMPRAVRHESRHEIDQLEETWKDAILKRNVPVLDRLLADDYIAITANGTLQSKEQALENLKSAAIRFNSIDLSDRKVRFYGQTALVTSRAEINGDAAQGDISGSYRFTRVYVRDGHGSWKIVSFEASRIRETGERPERKAP